MKASKILIAGDVHGSFSILNAAVAEHSPLMVLQCGDFGYWPEDMNLPYNGFKNASNAQVPVHFCDGNHENHSALETMVKYGYAPHYVGPGVVYQERGSTLTLPDDRVVLFAGGADSVDKDVRTKGHDWFPGELLTEKDFAKFPDVQVDIVISHAAPTSAVLPPPLREDRFHDPSRAVLQKVLERYKPSLWFGAHYHIPFAHRLGNCEFCSLSPVHTQFPYKVNPDGFAVLEL